jgi:hypothetical protein
MDDLLDDGWGLLNRSGLKRYHRRGSLGSRWRLAGKVGLSKVGENPAEADCARHPAKCRQADDQDRPITNGRLDVWVHQSSHLDGHGDRLGDAVGLGLGEGLVVAFGVALGPAAGGAGS